MTFTYISSYQMELAQLSGVVWLLYCRSGGGTYVKYLLSSAGVERGMTPPLVSITALTGLVVHTAWLQGHVAAPLCHEPQRHLKL